MGGNNSDEVVLPTGKEVEDPDTTVEIKIKTMDSQTYSLRVNKRVPVPALKEQIASVTGVLSEQQRLICRGKVLKDDELLSAHHVEDGHTLHLVVRQPFQAMSSPAATSSAPGSGAASISVSNTDQNHGRAVTHNIVFEAVNLGQGDTIPPFVTNIVSNFLRSFNIGSTNGRNDFEEMLHERRQLEPATSRSQDPNIAQPSAAPRVDSGLHQAAFPFAGPVQLESRQPAVIPDSLTTINEYLGLLREEFRREGYPPYGGQDSARIPRSLIRGTETQVNDLLSHVAEHGGIPGPEALAQILTTARQLLIEQAGPCLSQIAELLEGHRIVSDAATRMNIQSSVIRVGGLLQHLGPLLLELGRTTMTLRMGQGHQDAVVNAGPAVYVSATGPNPLMVQPFPLYPGPNISRPHIAPATSSGPGSEGLPFLPRSIDIRIHTGHGSPVARASASEPAATQQPQEPANADRSTTSADLIRMISELASNASVSAQSGVRVVPIRTVVAVPTGLNHPQPDSSSGSGIGMFYPILARVQHLNSGNTNEERGFPVESSAVPHTGNDYTNIQQPTLEPASQSQNHEVHDTGEGTNGFESLEMEHFLGTTDGAGQDGLMSETEALGTDEVDDQGRLFASLLQQIIPIITNNGGESLTTSHSSPRPRDPPEDSNSKRRRME